MVEKLSILIPATGPQSLLEETLLSVLENRTEDCDVVVVHDPSFSDPYDLSDEIRFIAVDSTDVIQMLNTGIEACDKPWLHVLFPGCQVQAGWCDRPLEMFQQDSNLAAISPNLKVGKRGRPIRGLDYRILGGRRIVTSNRSAVLAPTMRAGFYKLSALRFMHGFDPDFGCLADVELGLRLCCGGYRSINCGESSVHQPNLPPLASPKGYHGGRLRARLWQLARRVQHVSGPSWYALLAELPLHGLGPRAGPAMLGFLSGNRQRSRQPIPISNGTPGQSQIAPARKAG